MQPVKNNFKAHQEFIRRLDNLVHWMLPVIDIENVKQPWLNFNYSILERIRYNLVAAAEIMSLAEQRSTFQLPIGILYRTILADIILYKYCRQVSEQVETQSKEAGLSLKDARELGNKAFEVEIDVVSSER